MILRNQNHPHNFNLATHRRHSAMGADAESSAIPILFQPNGNIHDPTGSTSHSTNTTQNQGRIQVGGGEGQGGQCPFFKSETKV